MTDILCTDENQGNLSPKSALWCSKVVFSSLFHFYWTLFNSWLNLMSAITQFQVPTSFCFPEKGQVKPAFHFIHLQILQTSEEPCRFRDQNRFRQHSVVFNCCFPIWIECKCVPWTLHFPDMGQKICFLRNFRPHSVQICECTCKCKPTSDKSTVCSHCSCPAHAVAHSWQTDLEKKCMCDDRHKWVKLIATKLHLLG